MLALLAAFGSASCGPGDAASSWEITHRNSRVIDPQENRDENPWEWRSNEMNLDQCKTKCNEFQDTCSGIEFECDDGQCDCIMLRGTERTTNFAQGWTIYARIDDGWTRTHRDSRVIDPQENRDENPWEWRSDEFTLAQCKGKCNEFPDTCSGIEFETYDGTSDCIMLRGEERTVNPAPGWTIFKKPSETFVSWQITHTNSRVIDPEENRDENPWEWRNNEMDLEQCKTKCWEFENTCTGIEFECDDGTCDCIMLRGTSRTVNNAPVK